MLSAIGERVIEDALQHNNAVIKFISKNDVDLTGGHQYGFYVPKTVYPRFTPQGAVKGVQHCHPVRVVWQDGRVTNSSVYWYGEKTRSEYRLTGFGKNFPFRTADNVGDLLVLIAVNQSELLGYVLFEDDDIQGFQDALGLYVQQKEGAYFEASNNNELDFEPKLVPADKLIDERFRAYVAGLSKLPKGEQLSDMVWETLSACIKGFSDLPPDDVLRKTVEAEFQLFKMAEKLIRHNDIHRLFSSIDEFLVTAQTILQSRKSRAGRALENHVERLFSREDIPFDMRPSVDGKPDLIIPSKAAYIDNHGEDKVFVVGIKTTCKDRWRQVVREARQIKRKYILTFQEGISPAQLEEMRDAEVSLIVPEALHSTYPIAPEGMEILTVAQFIDRVKLVYPTSLVM